MKIYCDTSVLIAALTFEPQHPDTADWLAAQPPGTLVASEWVATEIASALSLKVRTATITDQERRSALAGWAVLRHSAFDIVVVSSSDFQMATRILDNPQNGLHAGDALHLAIALNRGLAVATLDKRVVSAGPVIGVQIVPMTAVR